MARRLSWMLAHTIGAFSLIATTACYDGLDGDDGVAEDADDDELDVDPKGPTSNNVCGPTMSIFPVVGPHNIGYDAASCGGPGGCAVSCPDEHANSDWNPAATHDGIDVFAHEGAELVAVADGVVTAVGVVSDTSGIRVKIKDACGWSYYYGHMLDTAVEKDQAVQAGDLIGWMGHTGTGSTHLHFNVSPGAYDEDINPIDLLVDTSPTACGGDPTPPPPSGDDGGGDEPPPPPPDEPPPPPPPVGTCGVLQPDTALGPDQPLVSCDGRFAVLLQTDGNVVLYDVGTSAALWQSGTVGQPGAAIVMQSDGNFVLYASDGTPLWHTSTFGHPGAWLNMQDDGNLVIYEGTTPLWWTAGA